MNSWRFCFVGSVHLAFKMEVRCKEKVSSPIVEKVMEQQPSFSHAWLEKLANLKVKNVFYKIAV